jgi:hypothetical protein
MPGTCGGTLIANPTINRAVVNALGCFLRSAGGNEPVSEGPKPAKTRRLPGRLSHLLASTQTINYIIG